ncbi:polysaccharide deacetylase family protein [Candidatus Woesearchaeota archaeon]|nr:polysaccharide deacetylase family protein [Candidatus Woesearchaeota archaeon]
MNYYKNLIRKTNGLFLILSLFFPLKTQDNAKSYFIYNDKNEFEKENTHKDIWKNLLEKRISAEGNLPIIMYHGITDKRNKTNRFTIHYETFEKELETLYKNNFRLISFEEWAEKDFENLKEGQKPFIMTFDDASPGQFLYDDSKKTDSTSAVEIIERFFEKHPDFGNKEGIIFFIDRAGGVPFGQEKYVKEKLEFLVKNGYSLGNHSYSHPDFKNLNEKQAEEEIKKLEEYIHEFLPYYNINKYFAYPFGSIPPDKIKAKVNELCKYIFHAWGGLEKNRCYDNKTNKAIHRIEITGNKTLEKRVVYRKKTAVLTEEYKLKDNINEINIFPESPAVDVVGLFCKNKDSFPNIPELKKWD